METQSILGICAGGRKVVQKIKNHSIWLWNVTLYEPLIGMCLVYWEVLVPPNSK